MTRAYVRSRPWTEAERIALQLYASEGFSDKALAWKLNRTIASIRCERQRQELVCRTMSVDSVVMRLTLPRAHLAKLTAVAWPITPQQYIRNLLKRELK